MALLAIAVALLLIIASTPLLRAHPFGSFTAYILLMSFVPYWIGVEVGAQFVPLVLGTSVWLSFVLLRPKVRRESTDLWMALLVVLTVVELALGIAQPAHAVALIGAWTVPYIVGRYAGSTLSRSRVTTLLAIIPFALAIQSILEFSLDWHPFIALDWMAGPAETWSGIQYRSTFPRSEGAFGHSISLGAAISMGVPFVLSLTARIWTRVMMVCVMGAGVLVTFSRNALISFVVAIFLSVIFLSTALSRRQRVTIGLATSMAAASIIPIYLATIDGGTGVLEASTAYRANYFSIVPDVAWFGTAPIYVQYAPDQWGWAADRYSGNVIVTLDNTILLDALQFGWIHTIVLVLLLFAAGLHVFRRPTNPAILSAVSQYFTVATVAMITQIPYLFWLTIGLGVSWTSNRGDEHIHGASKSNESFDLPQRRRQKM